MNSDSALPPNIDQTTLDWSLVGRVLLIRLRSIGDTVLMTPCLSALKNWRPNIEITVVSEPLSAPLLENHPLVDELIVTNPSIYSRALLATRLRKARFDVAFNMHGGSTGTILASFAGAKRTAGYRGLRLARLLKDRAPSPDVILGRSRIHSVEQQLALLYWMGVPWPERRPELKLTVTPQSRSCALAKLENASGINERSERRYGCVVPGAAFESKQWTTDGFAAVADHLIERWNLQCLVVAGPGQEKLARDVAAATKNPTTVVSGLQLKELVALLERSQIFVGNDSGPMHIAAALNRPVVAIWGSSNPSVWHPWTEAPWRIVNGSRLTGEAPGLPIRHVPPADVIAAVDEVLERAVEANPSALGRSIPTSR
ncbi:MAG TPA: glycosyltransferase family 9 protein [Blastocatellia bacterium]|nr:glycosyltransferase family 9 protein [Blastocatellia bacterium]